MDVAVATVKTAKDTCNGKIKLRFFQTNNKIYQSPVLLIPCEGNLPAT